MPETRTSSVNLWWASSLTGLVAATFVIVLINWNRGTTEALPVAPVADRTVPAFDELQGLNPPRLIKTADFATALEEELARLQADIERAHTTVSLHIA